MKLFFKTIILASLFVLSQQHIFAQDDKTVTLTVSGQGQTQDAAKQNALRSAIEQAFGTFISSNTEIVNDDLVKDEIISVSNGNIQKFEILSEVKMPAGDYSTTLKATVSVSKLTSFCESKGVNVEFKGGLFSLNIKQQQLNEENESTVINNMFDVVRKLIYKSFNYELSVKDPVNSEGMWKVPMQVVITTNKNIINALDYLENTLSGIALTKAEVKNYKSLNKPTYPIILNSKTIHLRIKSNAGNVLGNILMNLYDASLNFTIKPEAGFDYINNRSANIDNIESFINSPQVIYICRGCSPSSAAVAKNHSIYESVAYAKKKSWNIHDYDKFVAGSIFSTFPGMNLTSISKTDLKIAKMQCSFIFTLEELEKISNFTITPN